MEGGFIENESTILKGPVTEKSLNFLLCNVRGLNSKADSVMDILVDLDIHIAFINETWFKSKTFDFEGFNCSFANRSNGRGGGLMTLVRKSLNPVCLQLDKSDPDSLSEWLFIKTIINNKVYFLMNVYGPQESEKSSRVESFFDKISFTVAKYTDFDDNVILAGDLNAKLNHSRNGKFVNNIVDTHKLRTSVQRDQPSIIVGDVVNWIMS